MLELKEISVQIPNWVDLDEAIPGYSEMNSTDQAHYQKLYSYACAPKLLGLGAKRLGIDPNQLPQDPNDLHALVYFIFYHNLAYLPSGDKIYPLLWFQWSQSQGVEMSVLTDRSSLLLPTIRILAVMPQVYFAALMLSFALFQRYNPKTLEYQIFFQLLESLLAGRYAKTFNKLNRSFVERSDYGWFFHYLPRPENFDFSSILDNEGIKSARVTLVGISGSEGGIFRRPQAASSNQATRMGLCCTVS